MGRGWNHALGRRDPGLKWRFFGRSRQKGPLFGVVMGCDCGGDGLKVLSKPLRAEGLNLLLEQRGERAAGERNGAIMDGKGRVGGKLVHLK